MTNIDKTASQSAEPVALTDERTAFEAAWRDVYPGHSESVFIPSRNQDNAYANTRTQGAWLLWKARARIAATGAQGLDIGALTEAVWNRLCELPDRNSPEDDPEACVCSITELRGCIGNALEEMEVAQAAPSASPAPAQWAQEDMRDAKRLDWLQTFNDGFYNLDRISSTRKTGFNESPTLREAIDAAMSREQSQGGEVE